VYFASYEWLKAQEEDNLDRICPVKQENERMRNFLWRLNAGGTAGVASWIVSLPQDVVKTKQQAHVGRQPLTFKAACS
jgi:hypothetical protein